MKKCICDDRDGQRYELQGDYYPPCLKLPEEEARAYWNRGTAAFMVSERK